MTTNTPSPTGSGFAEAIEFLVKGISIILGLLFVIGLLISNGHLMSFGIADFSELSTRNIMVGALFFYYVGMLVIAFFPIFAGTKILFSNRKNIKAGAFIIILALFVLMTGLMLSISGTGIGYVSLDGQSWDQVNNSKDIIADFRIGYLQFLDAYLHPQQIIAVVLLVLGIGTAWPLSNALHDNFLKIMVRGGWLISIVGALFLSISSYTTYVYPNTQFGLGGGQPQIVQLQVNNESLILFDSLGINIDKNNQNIAVTQPVAVWYQSSKYLYVTPLPNKDNEITLVAVGQDQILGMLYLRKYVKVESDRKISNLMPLP